MYVISVSRTSLSSGGRSKEIQVKGRKFRVHQKFLSDQSTRFADMFKMPRPEDGAGCGLSEEDPIVLDDVEIKDFKAFLGVIYSRYVFPIAACTAAQAHIGRPAPDLTSQCRLRTGSASFASRVDTVVQECILVRSMEHAAPVSSPAKI